MERGHRVIACKSILLIPFMPHKENLKMVERLINRNPMFYWICYIFYQEELKQLDKFDENGNLRKDVLMI